MKLRFLTAALLIGFSFVTGPAGAQQSTTTAAPPQAGYPAYSFNWFDPNVWMRMFYNPAAWTTQPAPATPTATVPVTYGNAPASYTAYAPSTGYPAGTFNWFDPNVWMSMFFNPSVWGTAGQPVATAASTPYSGQTVPAAPAGK